MKPAAIVICTSLLFPLTASAAEEVLGTGLRLPREKASQYITLFGPETRFRHLCAGGLACQEQARAWRMESATGFRPSLGLAMSRIDFGRAAAFASTSEGLNFSLMLGLHFGERASAQVRLGSTYGFAGGAPGLALAEQGWNRSYGLGMALGMGANWQAQLGWDRNRFEYAGGERDVDVTSVGLQYRF